MQRSSNKKVKAKLIFKPQKRKKKIQKILIYYLQYFYIIAFHRFIYTFNRLLYYVCVP